MPSCCHCGRNFPRNRLRKHEALCPLASLAPKTAPKRVSPLPPRRSKAARQRVDLSAVQASLHEDTHRALPVAPSDQLFSSLNPSRPLSSPLDPPVLPASSLSDDYAPIDFSPDDPAFSDDQAFLRQFLPMIDPDATDPFDPESFDESSLKYLSPRKRFFGKLPPRQCAQIDLLRILLRSGCSLGMFDKIMGWMSHYTLVDKNVFSGPLLRQKPLMKKLVNLFDTEGHEPSQRVVRCPRMNRAVTVPVYSFKEELSSLIHNEHTMSDDHIVDDYDLLTGQCGAPFWVPDSLSTPDTFASTPVPVDPERHLSGIHSSYLFQAAVRRFCTEPHHMPVPVLFGHDKANITRHSDIAVAPFLFSLGFYKPWCFHHPEFWRPLGYVPNLSVGVGKNDPRSTDDRESEHHAVFAEILRELVEITQAGGLKTVVRGKEVVLKFFVMYAVGDTDGHNEMTNTLKQAGRSRTCLCVKGQLGVLDAATCIPFSLRDVIAADGHPERMRLIAQRHRVPNAFYQLPFADRERNIHGSTLYERLHVFGEGIYGYKIESHHDIMGPKMVGKAEKATFNALHRQVCHHLSRQSERDFPRTAGRTDFTSGTCATSEEHEGNECAYVVTMHLEDTKTIMRPIYDKYRRNNPGRSTYPTIEGCRDASVNLLCYDRWINEEKPIGEVLVAFDRAKEVLMAIQERFPRHDSAIQYSIQKMHGAFQMAVRQQVFHGVGDGWTSEHLERMHQFFVTQIGRQTQQRTKTIARDISIRRWEGRTIDTMVECIGSQLMSGPIVDHPCEEEYEAHTNSNNSVGETYAYESDDELSECGNDPNAKWNYHDEGLPKIDTVVGGGRYSLDFHVGDVTTKEIDYGVDWNYRVWNGTQKSYIANWCTSSMHTVSAWGGRDVFV